MIDKINKFFYFIESTGGKICHLATWFFLFFLNPGHRFIEVAKQEMQYQEEQTAANNEINHEIDAEMAITLASSYFQEEVDRGKAIDEKNKILLTVATLFLASAAIMAPSVAPKWLVLIPQSPIMISIYLVLVHFGVQSMPVPDWKIVHACQNDEEAKRKLATEYFNNGDRLCPKNDFRVGIYRASIRSMIIGILLFFPLFVIFSASPPSDNKIIDKIKNDKQLQLILRGPTGPQGPSGPQGYSRTTVVKMPPDSLETPQRLPDAQNRTP